MPLQPATPAASLRAAARTFGTPLFVYDAALLRETYGLTRQNIPAAVDVLYSLKANPNVTVCALLGSLGAGAEVSSRAELTTALRAGIAPGDIVFLGPGKSEDDLVACVSAGVSAIVCESLPELRALDAIAARRAVEPVPVLLRVNPRSGGRRGGGLAMGGRPRQFGMDEAAVTAAADDITALRHVRVDGIHAYMGTRFLDHADVVRNTSEILLLAERLTDALGIPLSCVDFGGGLGVAYFDGEDDPDVKQLGVALGETVSAFRDRFPDCRLLMELGRYLTAVAGTYVVRTRYVKESMGEVFAVTDGGTHHHMAAVGIGSFVKRNFPIRHLDRPGEAAEDRYTVTGLLCTPNDVLAKKAALPPVAPGDLLAVDRSGAYGPTASPGLFLSHGFPAEAVVDGDRAHLVRSRDTVEDMLARQHLVDLGPLR